MIIHYRNFKREQDNVYLAQVVAIQGCCEYIINFILAHPVAYAPDQNILIVKPEGVISEKALQMKCCQFCGKPHQSIQVDEKGQPVKAERKQRKP